MKTFKKNFKFKDLSIRIKINLIIFMLTLSLSTIIIIFSLVYYAQVSSKRLLESTEKTTQSAAIMLNNNYNDILRRFVSICGSEEFSNDIKTVTNPSSTYIESMILLQDEIADLSHCHFLVNSAFILTGDGSISYTLYENSMHSSAKHLFSADELEGVKDITFFSQRRSPFNSSEQVVPIVFPITINANNFTEIGPAEASPKVFVVILLDAAKLKSSLAFSNLKDSQSIYYILKPNALPINIGSNIKTPDFLEDNKVKDLIQTYSESSQQTLEFVDSNFYLFASKLDKSNLILLNYVERLTIASIFSNTSYFLILTSIIVIAILLFISFYIARYVTRPVEKLIQIVNKIEENKYNEKQYFDTNDEIGQLSNAINKMHDTIQDQIQYIKQEEHEKHMIEIKLLTEQINPHFLYNTLECIQSEVLRNETDVASNMIQYLADYMRIGLSYGSEVISISDEIRHVNAYIRIMNQRFQQSITFTFQLSQHLTQHPILKTILQPLVENSIKHGFGIDASGIPISNPTIETNFTSNNDVLNVEIIDNGSGFDVNKVTTLMLGDRDENTEGHVGLYNVYQRLISYYGDNNVKVSFSSIPYYRNIINIELPMKEV